jgi:hypothetical protein
MGHLSIPEAMSLMTGMPVASAAAAHKAAEEHYKAFGPTTDEPSYRAKLDAIARASSREVARRYMFEVLILVCEDWTEETYNEVCDWVDRWYSEGAN